MNQKGQMAPSSGRFGYCSSTMRVKKKKLQTTVDEITEVLIVSECIVSTHLVIKSPIDNSLAVRRLGIQIQCWSRSAYAARHLGLPARSCHIFVLMMQPDAP